MPSKPNYLQRSLLQILSHWELGLQCMNLGDTDIQSMKQPTLQDESWSPSCQRFSGKLRLQYSEGLTLAWDSGGLMNVFGFTLSYFVTGSSCLPPGFPKIGWLCAICRSLQLSQSIRFYDVWVFVILTRCAWPIRVGWTVGKFGQPALDSVSTFSPSLPGALCCALEHCPCLAGEYRVGNSPLFTLLWAS